MIMKNPESLHSSNQGTRKDFEKSLNLQEIAISIISSQEMLFIRNFLKELFPLENLFQILDESIQTLNGFEKDDQDYDDQDYEELREVQYVDMINLYIQIYLHPTYSDTKKSELMSWFPALATTYLNRWNKFNSDADFEDRTTFRRSDLRLLLVYMQNFFTKCKKYHEVIQDRKLGYRYCELNKLSQFLFLIPPVSYFDEF